jgi:hypothetical protein
MGANWIPIVSAVAIIALSLGVLAVMSAGVRVDPPSAATWTSWDAPTRSEPAPDDLLTVGFGREMAVTTPSGNGEDP